MAEIFPFPAYRYNPARVRLDDVLTQPYDKIPPELQEQYYARSPFNLIPIEKGRSLPSDTPGNNEYTRAADAMRAWTTEGILVRDSAPSIYVYSQEYQVPGASEVRTRKGFIALGRMHDYADGVVFRHEHTHSGPKADRLELLRQTRCHTGQLFMLYADPARRIDGLLDQVSRVPAPVEVRDDFGVVHRVWPVAEADVIERLRIGMADQKLVIADGHHRYETALAYRNECRAAGQNSGGPDPNAPHEKVMMTFVNAHAEGLTILPTHRMVSSVTDFKVDSFRERLNRHFGCYSYPFTSDAERAAVLSEFRNNLARRGRERRAIGAYAGNGAFYLFVLRRDADLDELLPDVSPLQRQLDVTLLHRLLLECILGITADAIRAGKHVSYEREMEAAVARVDHGEAQLCLLLNPVRIEQVLEIALAGEVLPQKSTDFYPKLLSGLTVYRLEG
jgi:uncharacterized protein (DUF1015 family)